MSITEKLRRELVFTERKTSPIHGFGSFAITDILKGKKLFDFTGRIVNGVQLDEMIYLGMVRQDDEIQIAPDTFLILNLEHYFINHSCRPNCGVRGFGELFALKNICAGQELMFDYSTTVGMEGNGWEMLCNCGSPSCRGLIRSFHVLSSEIQSFYLKQGAVPNFLKEELIRRGFEVAEQF